MNRNKEYPTPWVIAVRSDGCSIVIHDTNSVSPVVGNIKERFTILVGNTNRFPFLPCKRPHRLAIVICDANYIRTIIVIMLRDTVNRLRFPPSVWMVREAGNGVSVKVFDLLELPFSVPFNLVIPKDISLFYVGPLTGFAVLINSPTKG